MITAILIFSILTFLICLFGIRDINNQLMSIQIEIEDLKEKNGLDVDISSSEEF